MKAQLQRIGDLADQIRGVTYRKQDASFEPIEGCLPVLRAGNITNEGLTYKDLVYVPAGKISVKQKIKQNDIVIAASSGSIEVVGKAARALEDFEGGFGAFCKVLRPHNDIDPTYFSHYFKTIDYRRRVSFLAAGANINNLRNEDLDGLQIPLPPLPEQKRIAAILDAADELRTKRRESIRLLDDLIQSTFLEMFGDPVTNPMRWEITSLNEIGTLDRGVSKHRPRNAPFLLGGPYPLIQTGDVSNSGGYITSHSSTYSELGLKQSKMWPAGTLCITIAANIASTGILTFDACFPDSVVGFTPSKDGTVEYVQGLFGFLKKILELKAPQVAQKNINLKILRNIPIPAPPIAIQNKFVYVVNSIQSQKARLQSHLDELDILFASIQQRAFNGEM